MINLIQQLKSIEEFNMAGVETYDIKLGSGSEIQSGNILELYYKLAIDADKSIALKDITLDLDKCIEYTYNPDIPISINYSNGEILDGLFEGMKGMRAYGGNRRIRIPSHLAYGSKKWDDKIPSNTDLIIEIHIAKILPNDYQ